ncbi:MAG TPA: OB-fold nucleic acid binding domain-containing protein [Paracoccaceae bacterium]|nr:OB-fold nucleic acid binding domain-containing protein [Paracoccaceae bacterium]
MPRAPLPDPALPDPALPDPALPAGRRPGERSFAALLVPTPPPGTWPRPPAAIPHARLVEPPAGARVTVAGLVLLRQRPGTAKGVIFVTLEDETGVANVVVWAQVFERFRRAVIAGRMLRVTGRLQREAGVVHVVAETVEDISHWLDLLLTPGFRTEGHRAGDQP